MSVFCRHNRFTAECPICSKGTVLDSSRSARSRSAGTRKPGRPARGAGAPPPAFSGPHVSAGPYSDEEGQSYVVRLERVPGGVRLAEWAGSALRRRAPVLDPAGLATLATGAPEALGEGDGEALSRAVSRAPEGEARSSGVSRGRSGEFSEELRVELLDDGRLRIARWVLRPGSGWQLQDAPPMLPAQRFADALADAAGAGLLASGRGEPARP